jgi:DNA sulfur modification protein DndD
MSAVRVLGWRARGLRCPDYRVSFSRNADNETYPVSFLQMPNGVGKTTTLKLLRAALSGTGPGQEDWTADAIRQMRKNARTRTGEFEVSLLVDRRRLTFTLKFDFEGEAFRQTTTAPTGGQKPGFAPPRELRRFLNPDFVNFFVFDGELADHLLDKDKTDAEQVIEDLFQLKIFDRMSEWTEPYVRDRSEQTAKNAADAGRATTRRGLSRWQRYVDKYTERLRVLRRKKRNIEKMLGDLQAKFERGKKQSDDAIRKNKDYRDRLDAAEHQLREAEMNGRTQAEQVLALFRHPGAVTSVFADEIIGLKRALDRVKLPESAARDFFEELAFEDVCVCGRSLDDESRQAIRDRAERYLGSEDVALLNAMKSDIAAQLTGDPPDEPLTLRDEVQKLEDAERTEILCRTEVGAINAEAVQMDPTLETRARENEVMAEKIGKLKSSLEQFENPVDYGMDDIETSFGIEVLERGLKRAKREYARIADTVELRQRCDIFQEIVTTARAEALRRVSLEVCRDANARIRDLMPNNSIEIDRVDSCLRLKAGKSGGSAGETLEVAYAFLSTLFNRANYELPFVVDSPAGPLDHPKRAAAARLIPRISGQFIAFVISTERDGFIDNLKLPCAEDIQYLTLFRKGDRQLEKAAAAERTVTEFSDGLLVSGKKFFEKFQLDKE